MVHSVLYPCEVGADLQLGQWLADVAAQLGRGGVWLLVMTAWVVEGAVDTGPDQVQVKVEFPCCLLEDLQTHTNVLQSLLGFSHGWIERDHRWDWEWIRLLLGGENQDVKEKCPSKQSTPLTSFSLQKNEK